LPDDLSGDPSKTPENRGTRLAPARGMFSTYLTSFFAMGFAATCFLIFKATVDRMWHLGE